METVHRLKQRTKNGADNGFGRGHELRANVDRVERMAPGVIERERAAATAGCKRAAWLPALTCLTLDDCSCTCSPKTERGEKPRGGNLAAAGPVLILEAKM